MSKARPGPVHLATVAPHAPVRAGPRLEVPACRHGLRPGAATLAATRHPADGSGRIAWFCLLDRSPYGHRAMISPAGLALVSGR